MSGGFGTFTVQQQGPGFADPAGAHYMSTVTFSAMPASSDVDMMSSQFGQMRVEHGPTELPPRPYLGGADAESPWKPRRNLGTIPGSALDYVRTLCLYLFSR